MGRNLILAGGYGHPVEETGAPLVPILKAAGLESVATGDIEGGLERLAAGEFDRLTVACLRFSMTQNEKYAPFRAEWGFSLSERGRGIIRDHVASGRGLLAIHGAPISFDTWPEWSDLLGVGWRWGISTHPPFGAAEMRPRADHPITRGMKPFQVEDEIYTGLSVEPWMTPVAEGRTPDTPWQPVVYAGEKDGARRAWCGFGHCAASFANPEHAAMIVRAAKWVAREI
jgi:type 1 glutamine amidotransferase